ncbi:MAG: SMC family ATPase [Candidatus Hadarchaeales archaeon]
MITRVRLKNWKSHEETDITFGDGTNVLIGPMGSGKSSVLEAMAYGLFGTLPGIQSRRIKLEDLIRSRPTPMDRAEVEVWFVSPDGTEYVVKRTISRGLGTASSELTKANGELVESGSTRVNEHVGRVLGMNYELFERAVYSEQNRLDYFLSLPKGKRMESIDELLGINRLENARQNIVSLINRVKDRAAETEDEARRRMEDKDVKEIDLLSSGLSRLEAEISDLRRDITDLEREADEARLKLDELGRVEKEMIEAEKTFREVQGKVDSLRSRRDDIRRRVGVDSEVPVAELESRVKSAEETYNKKAGELDGLNSEYASVRSRLSRIEAEEQLTVKALAGVKSKIEEKLKKLEYLKKTPVQAVKSDLESLVAEFNRAQRDAAEKRARLENIRKSLEELMGAGPVCPVCESPLDENRKNALIQHKTGLLALTEVEIREAESEVARISNVIESRNSELQKLLLIEKETVDLPDIESEAAGHERRLKAISSEKSELSGKLDELKSRMTAAKNELSTSEKALSEARQRLLLRKEQERIESELEVWLRELEMSRMKLEELKKGYDEKTALETKNRWEDLYGRLKSKQAELEGKESLAAERRKIVEGARKKLQEAMIMKSRAKHLDDAWRMLGLIQAALQKTQSSMRRMFVDGVNEVMNDLWESIYPYGDFVGIQLSVTGEGKTGDYVLMLRNRNGDWVPVEGLVSGGERTDACLALRIAFSIVLAPNLKWIVFDEPTHNLDSDGISELAKVLRERMPEVVRQVLLITHEERLESAVSGYLYRFFRNKDAEEPTRVEQVSAPEKMG